MTSTMSEFFQNPSNGYPMILVSRHGKRHPHVVAAEIEPDSQYTEHDTRCAEHDAKVMSDLIAMAEIEIDDIRGAMKILNNHAGVEF